MLFVQSGRSRYAGYIDSMGSESYFWTSRAYDNSGVQLSFALAFAAPDIHTSTNGSRWYGHPLRCLVR